MSAKRAEFRPFLMDTETMKLLQQMLHVGSGELTSGSTKEDFLEVVYAWQIKNPAQWVLLLEAREQITVKLQSPTVAGAAIAGETVEDDEFGGSDEDDILVSAASTVKSKIADEKAGVEDRPTDPIDRPIDRPTDLTDRPTDLIDRPTDRPTNRPTHQLIDRRTVWINRSTDGPNQPINNRVSNRLTDRPIDRSTD